MRRKAQAQAISTRTLTIPKIRSDSSSGSARHQTNKWSKTRRKSPRSNHHPTRWL